MHGGVGGAVSGDDDGIGEPDGETGGDYGGGRMEQVICIYPYVPLSYTYKSITIKMVAKEPAFERTLSWLQKDNNDDRIIASSIEYQIDNPSHKVFLVTSDINLQNKAEMAKLPFFETPQ